MEWCSARQAVMSLPRSGRVYIPTGAGVPVALCDALFDERDRFDGLEVVCGLLFRPLKLLEAAPHPFRIVTVQSSAVLEPLITAGRADYLPLRYSRTPQTFLPDGPLPADAALIQVSPPDARGFVSLGPSVGTALAVARAAPLVIAAVNHQCPRTHGEGTLHISEIDIAVETDEPLMELPATRTGDTERAIARHVANLVPDGATIQIGIGGVPNAILEALGNHRDLGIHSGMLSDGMVPLIEAGVITGARKRLDPYRHLAGEALGTRTLFDFIHGNPTVMMVNALRSHGLEYLQHQDGFVSINSALEVDLTGQVNAEWIDGRQVSGLGGSFDFTEAAMYARGGISIVALPATAARGKLSRIVRALPAGAAVTTPRHCVDYVVTEYGVAGLRAKTLRQRAEVLTAIAHPDFRGALAG